MVHQRVDRGRGDIEDRRRVDAEEDRQGDERVENELLAAGQVQHGLEALLLQRPEDHPPIQPKGIGGRQDHAGRREQRHPGVDLENADERQEFADESRRPRQADIGHREHHERQRVFRHVVHEAAIGRDLARMETVVDHADAQEQRAGNQPVREHLEDAALHALHVGGEDAHRHVSHVGDRGIGDQLLHVLLHQRDQRGVDDRHDREREDQGRQVIRGQGEHRQGEPEEPVAAELQQDARQDDRAGRRRLHVGVRQPCVHGPHRHLHREGGEEGEPQPGLHRGREIVLQEQRDVRRSRLPVHRHDGEQHQHRTEEGVEEELERGIDAARTAPHADDDEHRDEAALEEDVEKHDVERAEDADHHRLEEQEGDHVGLHALLHGFPARQDAERHQEGRQDDEQHRDAVHAHVVRNAGVEPVRLLDHLEAGLRRVEADPDQKRQHEGEGRRQQRDVADVAPPDLVVVPDQENQGRADERQEGDRGENRPIGHQRELPSIIQVTSAATPISIANA